MARVVVTYVADKEWDGRTMEIIQDDPTEAELAHYEEVRDVLLDQVGPGKKLGLFGASYNGQAERDWYLRTEAVKEVLVERDAQGVLDDGDEDAWGL